MGSIYRSSDPATALRALQSAPISTCLRAHSNVRLPDAYHRRPDYPTRDAALKLADQLDPKLCRVKVGKELFTSCAAEIVGTLRDKGFEVFLDLKFHDIPNTTAMAVKAAAEMGVWMVNVHCPVACA